MPETMSIERRKVLKALGAKPGTHQTSAEGMAGSIARAEEIVASDRKRFVMLQQFKESAPIPRSISAPPAPRFGAIPLKWRH